MVFFIMNACYLVLEDGAVFPGTSFGHPPPRAADLLSAQDGSVDAADGTPPVGEVVFNTGMAGYHEILTDPSYSGQIIVMTYPHIGNYGTDEQWTEYGPGTGEKWQNLKAAGLVVRSLYRGKLPPGRVSLEDFMSNYRTAGISDVDTRHLTLKIRAGGSPTGLIARPTTPNGWSQDDLDRSVAYLNHYPKMEGSDLVTCLGTAKVQIINSAGKPHISIVDCGIKAGIIRELVALGCRISLVPNAITPRELLDLNQDAVLISNGPGDPRVLDHLVELAREIADRKPLFGICLGHQIICLALGAEIFKMKFGHHGVNNPVRDEQTGIVLITSQNHGFSVEETSLPKNCTIWFRNANDKTVEGIAHTSRPILTAQFHPEAAPGPRDSLWIFQRFLDRI